jgi:hypothetical protein
MGTEVWIAIIVMGISLGTLVFYLGKFFVEVLIITMYHDDEPLDMPEYRGLEKNNYSFETGI